jgi:acid phosphatase class B
MAKGTKANGLRELQVRLERMRTALKDSQRELDKADKVAKSLKKIFAAANKNRAIEAGEKETKKTPKDNKKASKQKKGRKGAVASTPENPVPPG